jgi:hypothetical protein
MILGLIKTTFIFFMSFVILSIPLKNKPLFYHFDKIASPLTKKVHEKSLFAFSYTTSFLKDLFVKDNLKKTKEIQDEISSQFSSNKKIIDHNYLPQEKEKLEKILNN